MPVGALWCLVTGTVLLVVALRERERYDSATDGVPIADAAASRNADARLTSTDEVFTDPTTGERMRVWFDPTTGRRVYRPETNPGR